MSTTCTIPRQSRLTAGTTMRSSMTRRILGGLATVYVVGASSLALASPEEDVKATVGRWVQAFNTGNAEQIAATYTADATVYGTMAPDLAAGTEALHAYFAQAARARTQVKLLDAGTVNALSADHAVIAGLYEFSGVRPDGQAFSAPARYSFVLVKDGNDWRIVHHHSSARPRPANP